MVGWMHIGNTEYKIAKRWCLGCEILCPGFLWGLFHKIGFLKKPHWGLLKNLNSVENPILWNSIKFHSWGFSKDLNLEWDEAKVFSKDLPQDRFFQKTSLRFFHELDMKRWGFSKNLTAVFLKTYFMEQPSGLYRDGLKSLPVLLSNSQAGPGRIFSQPRDHFFNPSMYW